MEMMRGRRHLDGINRGCADLCRRVCKLVFDTANDHTIYHSGDTAFILDMKLIEDAYEPTVVILSSSGQFTMRTKKAA